MTDFLRALQQQYSLLWWSSLYTAALLVFSLVAFAFDNRLVVGANPWLKPLKFEVSVIIFNLTVGWMLLQLAKPGTSARIIAGTVGVAMIVEMTAITMQASRGIPSHYNVSSAFNAFVFNMMAIGIVCNTLAVAWLLFAYFAPQPQLAPAVAWGIRLGLVLFLCSSLQGFMMVAHNGHTVGAPDGGPGLPGLRWSTKAGDLRIAHFAGMHAIQLLPLLGYLLSRSDRQAGTPAVMLVSLLIGGIFVWTLRMAWAGRPLLQ